MTISHYHFEFQDQHQDFFYVVEEEMVDVKDSPQRSATLPAWTRLNCRQCSHCPLSDQVVHYCPPTLNMIRLVERFSECNSYDEVTLHVSTGNQKHSIKTDLQTALAHLYPVILFKSSCPYAYLLQPMERFIKPFPDLEDVSFYALSFELIKKRLLDVAPNSSGTVDINVNKDQYNVTMVFHGLLGRLRVASHNDANINAIIKDIQWMYSVLHTPGYIMECLKPYFSGEHVLNPSQTR